MLDIKLIRKENAAVEKKLKTKDPGVSLACVLKLDEEIREKKNRSEILKAKRNALSAEIAMKKQKGEDVQSLMQEVHSSHDEMRTLDHTLALLEDELNIFLRSLPNIPAEDVKVSQDPKENEFLHGWGEKREFDFVFKNHLELSEMHELFDFHRAAKTSGSGWPAYKGMGARLEWALISYMIEHHVKNGFTLWMPPLAVKREVMMGSGQLPKFEGQQYKISDGADELFLIPTAEVVLNGLHLDEIFHEEQLPLRYVAYTPCFRREAGAAGEKERGLIRMHQFNKVEMYAFATPEQSEALFTEFVRRAEAILEGLELHYRSMKLVTGDMSFAAARTVDIEVYLPGQQRYYEVSSVSNCTDYQARRSKIRYKSKQGKPELVHTLNGSGLATSRLLVAILENNQQKDGSIVVPKVLRPYLGGLERIEPRK